MVLKAAEILAHPGFQHLDWDLPTTTSGKCEVAKGRSGGPVNLYYETHGTGPRRLVFIMGLGAYNTAWKRQTYHFGHHNASKYTALVFDNRGIAQSSKPSTRYSTSEMAKDARDLLQSIGWLDENMMPTSPPSGTESGSSNGLVIAGVSMGGMIAQELALLLPPKTIHSLFLISTATRLVRTLPFMEHMRQRALMFVPRDVDISLEAIAHRLFNDDFLAEPDTEFNGGRVGVDSEPHPEWNFPTKQDRVAAGELRKRRDTEGFTKKGFILQAIAAGWHHVSKTRTQELAERVGRDRICVMHGTKDNMIDFVHAEITKKELDEGCAEGEGVRYLVWKNMGHVLFWEVEHEFNAAFQDFVADCDKLSYHS